MITADPSEGVKLPRVGRAAVAMERPTTGQVRDLLDVADRESRGLLYTYAHLWPIAEDRTRSAAAALLIDVFGAADEPLTNSPAA